MMDITKKHTPSDETKVITLRKCWSLIFDVNGNAPADATVASFATKELAGEALSLWAGEKNEDRTFSIVIGGQRYFDFPAPNVEGYNFDTGYRVKEDWQDASKIFSSLSELTNLDCCQDDTDLPDGVHFGVKNDEDEDEE